MSDAVTAPIAPQQLPTPPTRVVVFGEQLREVVGRFGLLTLLTAFVVTLALTVYTVVIHDGRQATTLSVGAFPYLMVAHGLVMAVAFFLPGAIWKGLPPGGRQSLRAHPVDHRTHELLRVAAGAATLVAFSVPVYTLGMVLQLRLLAIWTPVPSPGDWLLAINSALLVYLIGSVAALRTESATGTLARVIVWGFVAVLGITLLGGRVGFVARLWEGITRVLWTGPCGLSPALRAGFISLGWARVPVASARQALLAWLLLTALVLWRAAGASPRGR